MIFSALIASLTSLIVGLVVAWANPRRGVNRVFATISWHAALWLGCLYGAFGGGHDGLIWLRLASAVGTFFPLHFWVLQVVVLGGDGIGRRLRRGLVPGLIYSVPVAALCFTTYFVPEASTKAEPIYGFGYYLYLAAQLGLYAALAWLGLRAVRRAQGAQRLELQLVLLGGCATAAACLALVGLSATLGERGYVRSIPVVALLFWAATVWTLTTHRIFDARHLSRIVLHRAVLVLISAGSGWGLLALFGSFFPPLVAYVCAVGLVLWIASVLGPALASAVEKNPAATNARRAAFEVAANESRAERVEPAFRNILRAWSRSEQAMILLDRDQRYAGEGGVELPVDSAPVRVLRRLRWATPERLARERESPEVEALRTWLREHQLGAVVLSSPSPTAVIIGVGVPPSRRPFTYPDIVQLTELASIVENTYARLQLLEKAQHAEQLATVGVLGASLAHEIRNPLVTIKTFVQLLPHHYHDPKFRERFFRLMGDEVNRIDRLTEQLLDLAHPKAYQPLAVSLHACLQENTELIAAKAEEKGVRFETHFAASPDFCFTDPAAVSQVILNLCFNGLQAVEQRSGERWVRVATTNVEDRVELSIADSGPGIAPEVWRKLFQPFQTTKSSGFGLGLATCHDILGRLHATITADRPLPGQGATFRVRFPCQPPSS